jgi:putative sugar O-methyltransferase
MTAMQDRSIVVRALQRCFHALGDQPAVPLPPHSTRWAAYVDRIRESLPRFSTPLEAVHFAQSRIGFGSGTMVEQFEPLLGLVEDQLYAEFPQFTREINQFADSAHNYPGTTLIHKGRPVGNVMFLHVRYVLTCLTHIPVTDTVMEIGSGYGAAARFWRANPIRQPRRQVLVDIPECLFFADVFLSAEFSPDEVGYVTSSNPADIAKLDTCRFILCPLNRLDALQAVHADLVINTGSLQEMNEEWVDFYMGWLDRQPCRYFYSLNYFAQPISFLAESANLYSPRLSSRWVSRLLRWNPPLVRTYTTRNFLEIIAERFDDAALNATEGQAAWNRVAERFMTGQVFAEMMDVLRRYPHEELVFATMLRAATEIADQPKEILYLANWLAERGSRPFYQAHRDEIDTVRTHFFNSRTEGRESVY